MAALRLIVHPASHLFALQMKTFYQGWTNYSGIQKQPCPCQESAQQLEETSIFVPINF